MASTYLNLILICKEGWVNWWWNYFSNILWKVFIILIVKIKFSIE